MQAETIDDATKHVSKENLCEFERPLGVCLSCGLYGMDDPVPLHLQNAHLLPERLHCARWRKGLKVDLGVRRQNSEQSLDQLLVLSRNEESYQNVG